MKKYRVEIKPTAENDLVRKYAQIEKESSQNAVNWYLRVIEAIEKLKELAGRCPIAREDLDIQRGIRYLFIGNYRVLYVIEGDAVSVVHVQHGRHDRKL